MHDVCPTIPASRNDATPGRIALNDFRLPGAIKHPAVDMITARGQTRPGKRR